MLDALLVFKENSVNSHSLEVFEIYHLHQLHNSARISEFDIFINYMMDDRRGIVVSACSSRVETGNLKVTNISGLGVFIHILCERKNVIHFIYLYF